MTNVNVISFWLAPLFMKTFVCLNSIQLQIFYFFGPKFSVAVHLSNLSRGWGGALYSEGAGGRFWPSLALLFECTTFTTPSHPPTSPYLTLFKVPALLVQCPKPHITANWESKSVSQLDKGAKERPTLKSTLLIKSLGEKFLAALFFSLLNNTPPRPLPRNAYIPPFFNDANRDSCYVFYCK